MLDLYLFLSTLEEIEGQQIYFRYIYVFYILLCSQYRIIACHVQMVKFPILLYIYMTV